MIEQIIYGVLGLLVGAFLLVGFRLLLEWIRK